MINAFDGKYKEAIEFYERGIAACPNSIIGTNNLAVCAMYFFNY